MAEFRYETDSALIVVAMIEGAVEDTSALTDRDMEYLDRLTLPSRRAEWIAWRNIARRELGGAEIAYDANGAPRLTGSDKWNHIGVSHTRGAVAVIFSNSCCAIDMEPVDRNMTKVIQRIISGQEAALASGWDGNRFLTTMWCAKETLYKLSGRKELNLTDDIRILSADPESGAITGNVLACDGKTREYRLQLLKGSGWMNKFSIVYGIDKR